MSEPISKTQQKRNFQYQLEFLQDYVIHLPLQELHKLSLGEEICSQILEVSRLKNPSDKKRQLKFIRKNLTHADFALLQQHAEQSNKTKLLKNQLHLQVQRLDYTKILEGDTSELEKFLKNLSLEGKKSFHKICKQASDEHNLKKALKPLLDSSISRTIADFQQD